MFFLENIFFLENRVEIYEIGELFSIFFKFRVFIIKKKTKYRFYKPSKTEKLKKKQV